MRLFAISDLHIDYPRNYDWVAHLSHGDYVDDAIIIAGDISNSTSLVEQCFEQFSRKFSQVFYVPGNHDLWADKSNSMNSLDKFWRLREIAKLYGVHVDRYKLGDTEIIPLLSWYDFSFGNPNDDLMRCWMDFHHCKWSKNMKGIDDVANFFFDLNRDLSAPQARITVSFSHFLPRIDLMPSYIPIEHQLVYPVLGSLVLDKQIRALGSSIHIYGHSHVNRDVHIGGVRYVNNAFGYPSEIWTKMNLVCVLEEV